MKRIEDRVGVSDSKIRGVVVIKRPDGTVLLRKENAIVQNGRKFIRDKFVSAGLPAATGFASPLSNYTLTKVGFGGSDVATEYTMTGLVNSGKEVALDSSKILAESDSMFVRFTAEMDRSAESTGYTIREIGLIMESSEESEGDLLFSRAVFDPITVAPGEKYQVEYYIYF
jgi:hypothetical protein